MEGEFDTKFKTKGGEISSISDQSINSVIWSIILYINQPLTQSINQSLYKSVNLLINQSINH